VVRGQRNPDTLAAASAQEDLTLVTKAIALLRANRYLLL
jgi:hypothetical protein